MSEKTIDMRFMQVNCFFLENTACLSTFVKMRLYNSEENICSVYKCAF